MKNKIEAILFAKGKIVSLEELKRLLDVDGREIAKGVRQLEKDYENRETSLQVLKYPGGYKLAVKNDYAELVRNIIPETEMPRAVVETLAIIAWKHPNITQSEIIQIRSSNAYEHLKDLEKMGFIKREPMGRTKKIQLTSKFFNYFDIDDIKPFQEDLSKFSELEEAYKQKLVEVKEEEQKIKTYNKLVKRVMSEEAKKLEQVERGDIDDILDKEEDQIKKKGVQINLNEVGKVDKDFLSHKINDELDKEVDELKHQEEELREELEELEEKTSSNK